MGENNKIKILEMFGEPITYGGQESVVFNMLSSFSLDNIKIDLFTPYYADNINLIDLINKNNGNIFHLDLVFKTGDNRFLLKNNIENFLKEHQNYDIVHIHTGSLSSMVLYAVLAKKYNIKKVVCHAHISGQKSSFIRNFRKYFLCSILAKNVDYFVGCSKEAIIWEWTNDIIKQAKVINNGIDIEKFKFNEVYRSLIRNKYCLKDKFVIGNVGRFSDQKNHLFMIDIFERICSIDKNCVLMLVGDGDLKNDIIEYAKNKNIYDKLIIIDNTEEVYKYYQCFDVFIMPSKYEGLPVVGIEAQISGLFTFVSKNISNELKISDRCIYLDTNSTNLWVDSILKIKNDNFLRFDKNNFIDSNKYDKNESYKYIEKIYNE